MLIFREIDSTLLACLEMVVNAAYTKPHPIHMEKGEGYRSCGVSLLIVSVISSY